MTPDELRDRTRRFAVDVTKAAARWEQTSVSRNMAVQASRAATAVAANYRAACLARSPEEFFARIAVVAEEADEVVYWLGLLDEVCPSTRSACAPLLDEARQVRRIMLASRQTARRRVALRRKR